MDIITHNTTDLADNQRTAIEQLLGIPLGENQRIAVQVLDGCTDKNGQANRPSIVDYAILADLNDVSLGEFDAAIERSPSRDQPEL